MFFLGSKNFLDAKIWNKNWIRKVFGCPTIFLVVQKNLLVSNIGSEYFDPPNFRRSNYLKVRKRPKMLENPAKMPQKARKRAKTSETSENVQKRPKFFS